MTVNISENMDQESNIPPLDEQEASNIEAFFKELPREIFDILDSSLSEEAPQNSNACCSGSMGQTPGSEGAKKPEAKKRGRKPKVVTDCYVCGRVNGANKSAFGGQSCPSCRIFFKRIVLSGKYKSIECLSQDTPDKCAINSRSWRSCSKCRLNRCITLAGMKTDLVEGDPKDPKENPQQPLTDFSSSIAAQMSDQFTVDQAKYLLTLRDQFIRQFSQSLVAGGPELVEKLLECFINGDRPEKSENVMIVKVVFEGRHRYLPRIPELERLSTSEQYTLLNLNFPMFQEYNHAVSLRNPGMTKRKISDLIGYLLCGTPDDRLQAVGSKYDIYMQYPSTPGITYDQMYPKDFFSCPELQQEHKQMMRKLASFSISEQSEEEAVTPSNFEPVFADEDDEILTLLIGLVLLFSTSGLGLEEPSLGLVRAAQRSYSHLMYTYLRFKYEDPVAMAKKFAESMTVEELARQVVEIKWRLLREQQE